MKLIFEHYRKIYSVATEYDDVTLDEQFEFFIGLLKQAGYNEQGIKETIIELAESYKE